MRVGYLTNQYPASSHTFIRREIRALEDSGVHVERYTIRRSTGRLVDPEDFEELERTHCILGGGAAHCFWALARETLRQPLAMARAIRLSQTMATRSSKGRIVHLAYLAEACILQQWLREHRIEHLHAHFGTNSTTVAMFCRLLGGPPFSFTVHGPDEFDRPEALSLGDKIAAAEFVAAISQFGRSQVLRWCPPDAWEKAKIVRCGINAEFRAMEPSPVPDTRQFIWVGRLASPKGLPILLEACRFLAAAGETFKVVLAGDGPLREFMARKIDELGLHEHMELAGWLGDAEIRDLIEQSRAMLVPSFAEGLPVVVMESLARGRPVIATRIAGIPELVVDGENGWIIPPGNVEALAEAMRTALATTPATLSKMGAAGRAAALEAHDVRKSAAQLRELFSSSIDASKT